MPVGRSSSVHAASKADSFAPRAAFVLASPGTYGTLLDRLNRSLCLRGDRLLATLLTTASPEWIGSSGAPSEAFQVALCLSSEAKLPSTFYRTSAREPVRCALPLKPECVDEISRSLRAAVPRYLLIDLALCARLNPATLAQLRLSRPSCRWIVGWSAPSLEGLDLLTRTGAVGALRWDSSIDEVDKAVEAMRSGELWFPRAVLQGLYQSLRARAVGQDVRPEVGGALGESTLTPREYQVLELLREGMSNKEIAATLCITINTVKKHIEHTFAKRGMHRRRQILE